MALTLQHQTTAEFIVRVWTRVRSAYQAGDKHAYHRLIWWIWTKIQAGDVTSDQMRIGYNTAYSKALNTTQWNSFVTSRLVPIKDRYLAWLAEADL